MTVGQIRPREYARGPMPVTCVGGYDRGMTATAVPSTKPSRVRSAGAWTGGIAYPLLLAGVVVVQAHDPTYLRLLVPLLLGFVLIGVIRRHPVAAHLLIVFGWTAVVPLVPGTPIVAAQVLVLCAATALLAARTRPGVSLPVAAVTLLGQLAALTFDTHGAAYLDSGIFALLAMIIAWMGGNTLRVRRAHRAEVHAKAHAQAITDERLRIARELHDMVAHSIGIIAIQAGVGARIIDTQPAEARNALATIETTSRETLAGLRRALVSLRRADADGATLDPTPGLADLQRLATATRAAGLTVNLRVTGDRRPLPPDIDLSAYRILQEALTNVVRHAGTDQCEVSVEYRPDDVFIGVTDDGRGAAIGATGYGLTGMRERVDLLGGELTAGPIGQRGFRVAARLPVPATVAAR
jgi:signal transduction histidine kinase